MIIVGVCVGSAWHLKGAPRVVGLLREKMADNLLEDEIVLVGAFCSGRCNRIGVTITVDGEVYVGITPEGFGEFWEKSVMPAVVKAKAKEN